MAYQCRIGRIPESFEKTILDDTDTATVSALNFAGLGNDARCYYVSTSPDEDQGILGLLRNQRGIGHALAVHTARN